MSEFDFPPEPVTRPKQSPAWPGIGWLVVALLLAQLGFSVYGHYQQRRWFVWHMDTEMDWRRDERAKESEKRADALQKKIDALWLDYIRLGGNSADLKPKSNPSVPPK